MESTFPKAEDIKDLNIRSLGDPKIDSTLKMEDHLYTDDSLKVIIQAESPDINDYIKQQQTPPMFEVAGPRKKIFFDPKQLTAGIVTCGGLCPGLNDVIRTITLTLLWQYGVKKVLGFRYGYEGLSSNAREEPVTLTPDTVANIQHEGGTILASSRGPQDRPDMVNVLEKHNVGILFVIGGDGTFHAAHDIVEEIERRKASIAVVGIPKTIDNDIFCSEVTFGFGTSVEQARIALASAHSEATAAYNGIGLVKLMGRDSGFIATAASLANSDVNFCLIPEVPFKLEGEDGFFARLERRLAARKHAVIVVAEGAGQDIIAGSGATDKSGNVRYGDIGLYLKDEIGRYFKEKKMPISLKYIDPSYTIRSCPANARDSVFCLLLGQNAVHAGMAGKTDLFIGYWNHHFTHVPLPVAINKRKKVNPDGILWQTLLSITDGVVQA